MPLDGTDVPYLYGADCTEEVVGALARQAATADRVFFVADRNVAPHATTIATRLARHVPVITFFVDADENHKRLSLVEDIMSHAIRDGFTRRSIVVGMGGGMVGNVAGLAAALMYRGTKLVHLPTTPVAAFDSVLSVKQAVNLNAGKNLCGTYFAPDLIVCDLRWLATVPPDELFTGLAEMAKNVLAVLPDREEALVRALHQVPQEPIPALLELLTIGRVAKAPFLVGDPRERREALIFEYGHTTGHALEFLSRGDMKHGEAVAWGMLVAAEVSYALGHLGRQDLDRHYWLINCLRLPSVKSRLARVDRAKLRAALANDNKRGYVQCGVDEVAMVLLESLGNALVDQRGYPLTKVPIALVVSALDSVVASADHLRPPTPLEFAGGPRHAA